MGVYCPMMLVMVISLLAHSSRTLVVRPLHYRCHRVISGTVVTMFHCDMKSLTSRVPKSRLAIGYDLRAFLAAHVQQIV
jgi:hypothetical protein